MTKAFLILAIALFALLAPPVAGAGHDAGGMAVAGMTGPDPDCPDCGPGSHDRHGGQCPHVSLCLAFSLEGWPAIGGPAGGPVGRHPAPEPWSGRSRVSLAELQPPRISAGFA